MNIKTDLVKQLGSSNIPFHILYKSHAYEKLDLTCIGTSVKIEAKQKYSELLIKCQLRLKSFIRQSKCVAESTLKLISNEESAKLLLCQKSLIYNLKRMVCASLLVYIRKEDLQNVGILHVLFTNAHSSYKSFKYANRLANCIWKVIMFVAALKGSCKHYVQSHHALLELCLEK